MSTERATPWERGGFRHFLPMQTRWMDNDVYGHLNNVVYYSYFDTAVNEYLLRAGVLTIDAAPVIGLVVETGCSYFSELAFPQALEVGVRAARIGNSSVRYEIAIFAAGEVEASAQGHFVHVYVDRASHRPVPLPPPLRVALESIR